MRLRQAVALGVAVAVPLLLAACGSDTDGAVASPDVTHVSSVTVSSGPPSEPVSSEPLSSEPATTESPSPATAGTTTVSSSTRGGSSPSTPASGSPAAAVTVGGKAVNVRCTGPASSTAPTVILLAGMPDPLTNFDALQKSLSATGRVCSYDRLGEGASDKPTGPVSLADSAAVLDGVLKAEQVTGQVVLVAHSLGGLVAAEYAHEHQDTVAGLVLLDATPPSIVEGILTLIPESATGIAAEGRGEMTSLVSGKNPEKLVYSGAPIGSIGSVPLTVVRHGKPVYTVIPVYGARLEKLWATGQQQWAALSSAGKLVVAETSGHYIYQDQPDLVQKLVAGMVAG